MTLARTCAILLPTPFACVQMGAILDTHQSGSFESRNQTMFVIECTLGNGTISHRCFMTENDVEKAWSIFVDQGRHSPGEDEVPRALILYETTAETAKDARKIIVDGRGQKIKRVAFSKPPELDKKVSRTGPGLVNTAAFKRAQAALDDIADDYLSQALDGLTEMEGLLKKITPGESNNSSFLKDFYTISYRAKSQGGTFGYQLITMINDRLCNVLTRQLRADAIDEKGLETLQVHLHALRMVVGGNIKGDGGKQGIKLIAGLDALPDTQPLTR